MTAPEVSRRIVHRYRDPVDEIWLGAAKRVGLHVRRDDAVFASYDGAGTLTVTTPAHFDPDDSLAQMLLHEMCHALVAGTRGTGQVDWGLTADGRTLTSEHACHRLQAALADRYGLREFFAVTTDHRAYWDGLPADPLAPGEDPAIEMARDAMLRSEREPWASALTEALRATARIAEIVRPHAGEGSLWGIVKRRHPSGFLVDDTPGRTCGECAWSYTTGTHRPLLRCRRTRSPERTLGVVVERSGEACDRWEQPLDAGACGGCGACCREGFHLVPVEPEEPICARHRDWIVTDAHGLHLPRPGGRCVALSGDGESTPFRCRAYPERPRSCREFEIGGDACLEARRRVGLSR